MKYLKLLIIVLLIAGCKYEDPLTEEHKIPIDPAVLGQWEHIPDEGEKSNPNDIIVVLKYSDTEYLIAVSPADREEGGMYFRGYPIKIGGISCVQLKVIGIWSRPIDNSEEKHLFDVASYRFQNNELTVKMVNPEVVDPKLKGKDLEAAFLKNKDNKNLFADKYNLRFKKVESKR